MSAKMGQKLKGHRNLWYKDGKGSRIRRALFLRERGYLVDP